MELTLLILLQISALLFTYLSFSKNADQTYMNKLLCGLLWFTLAFNSLVIHYYIPNGSISSYTPITDNSEYWQKILALIYGMIGFGIWIQTFIDYSTDKEVKNL